MPCIWSGNPTNVDRWMSLLKHWCVCCLMRYGPYVKTQSAYGNITVFSVFSLNKSSHAFVINIAYFFSNTLYLLCKIYNYEGGTISLATLILGHWKFWLFYHYCDVLHPRNKWNLLSKEYLHRHWKNVTVGTGGQQATFSTFFLPQKIHYRLDFKYFFLY